MFGAYFSPSSSFLERRFVFPLPYALGIIMQEHKLGGGKTWLQATVVHDTTSTVVWRMCFTNKLTDINLKHLLYKYLVNSVVISSVFVYYE